MKNCIIPSFGPKLRRPGGGFFCWFVLAAAVFAPAAHAQQTDLSNRPLSTRALATVKPNLMFILDDSGSMAATYMPQDLRIGSGTENGRTEVEYYGFRSAQCNGLAYDPTVVYTPPLYANGNSYPPASFPNALDDGFITSSAKTFTNLIGRQYYVYTTGTQPKMGWVYDSGGVVNNTFYQECTTQVDKPSSLFIPVTIQANSADRLNYANWYSYYRSRRLLMRTGVGQSLSMLDTGYRVGFSKISDPAVREGSASFRDVRDFDATQKGYVYDSLYTVTGTKTTPLRGALAKAGQYFAKKAIAQTYDPVDYSCQRNYALLTTDGYWNTGHENPPPGSGPAPTYGPYKLDNSTLVGDQDGAEARPMKDALRTSNTLADVAQYYYVTDLRNKTALNNCISGSSGKDTCPDMVSPVGRDTAVWQHMTTFTVGLGVSGTFPYEKDYLDPQKTTGAYAGLSNGTLDWPVPQATPAEGATGANIDDLWHAAVNGRGAYYSALSTSSLVSAIRDIVLTVRQVAGAASAASTDSLELVPGLNNQTYKASYTTEAWTGDLQAFSVNGADASVGKTAIWSAQQKLDVVSATARTIKFLSGGVLKDFDYNNMNATQRSYFSGFCNKVPLPDQCTSPSPAFAFNDLGLINNGANLVNYLRGQRDYESIVPVTTSSASATVLPLYRSRLHLLGDIVSGAPKPVGPPNLGYGDAGYTAFALAQSTRQNVVYTAANDGMLHAFAADGPHGGEELWAYVPGAVMPNLYKLADKGYAGKHQYSADGAPVMADVKIGTSWRTILVAGLNAGGRGYYAVDVTNPANPQALWEFTDANMGLSYGNPVIGKLADGTWVVAFTSGYNNDGSVGGDGKGHLYVVDAATGGDVANGGKLIDIATTSGTSIDPSGLAKISAWIDDPADKTIKRIYGGDLKGNLWRFDLDGLIAPKQSALLLAKLQATPGVPQPVTIAPELTLVAGKAMVLVATGRYLGINDVTDTTQQSIYGIKDPLDATSWGDVHADTIHFVKQTFTVNPSTGKAYLSHNPVDLAAQGGWWADLASPGERVTTALKLEAGTMTIASGLPSTDPCVLGGSSSTYFVDSASGGALTADGFAGGVWNANSLIAGMTWVKDTTGQLRLIVQGTNGIITTETPPIPSISAVGLAHRTSWRELAD
jgi:type IV pilus assembly protein PilY1